MKPIRVSRVRRTSHLRSFLGDIIVQRMGERARRLQLPRMAIFAHDEIGDWVVIDGRYEADILDAITGWLVPRALPEHRLMTALDIGANIGNHTLAFAPVFARVLAFEPNPIALHLLRANVEINQLRNVEIVPFALGSVDETQHYHVVLGNLGASHFVASSDGDANPQVLDVRQGDQFLREYYKHDHRIGLVKLDVEGMEATVFEGLTQTLERHKPIVLFEAITSGECKRSVSILCDLGYEQFFTLERYTSTSASTAVKAFLRLFYGADVLLAPLHFGEEGSHSLVIATTSAGWLPQN
jgi:FkbM family methyltransferase